MIAGSLSSFIAGFHRSWRFSQSFSPRRSCVGTGPAFAAAGVGSHDDGEGGHKSRRSCAGLIRRMSMENPLWGRRASTANCSNSGLASHNQASPRCRFRRTLVSSLSQDACKRFASRPNQHRALWPHNSSRSAQRRVSFARHIDLCRRAFASIAASENVALWETSKLGNLVAKRKDLDGQYLRSLFCTSRTRLSGCLRRSAKTSFWMMLPSTTNCCA